MPEVGISPSLRPAGFFERLPASPSLVQWVVSAVRYLDRPSPQVFVPAQLISLHGVRTVDICAAAGVNVSVQHAEPADAVQVASSGRRVYVYVPPPLSDLSPLGAMVFNLVRSGGEPPVQAVRAARFAASAPEPVREAYVTLLQDGTPWQRAAGLAGLVTVPGAP